MAPCDGSSIDFVERDVLSYHTYDLWPLLSLALAIGEDGEDMYRWQASNGASIAQSVAWMLPYAGAEKSHAEFVGGRVSFDKARSANHEKGHEIGSLYDPKNAIPMLDLAAAYDARCATLARQLEGTSLHLRLLLNDLH